MKGPMLGIGRSGRTGLLAVFLLTASACGGGVARKAEHVAKGQHPFAVVLSCSDSRVPPEIIFDQGIGNLFVVRCAGNTADDAGLGSIEYAAEHLHVSLIVVLGHQRCGAVEAAVKGGEALGHIKSLVEAIRPAVEKVKGRPGDLAENAMRGNVKLSWIT